MLFLTTPGQTVTVPKIHIRNPWRGARPFLKLGMPQVAPLDALLDAYRSEIGWLLAKAKEFEEKQPLVAADYIHRARNLQAIIQGYERVNAKRAL